MGVNGQEIILGNGKFSCKITQLHKILFYLKKVHLIPNPGLLKITAICDLYIVPLDIL